AALRQHGAELRQRVRTEQSVESADDPDPDEQPGIRQQPRDVARSAQNAAADRIPDRDGEAERQAENLEERCASAHWHTMRCADASSLETKRGSSRFLVTLMASAFGLPETFLRNGERRRTQTAVQRKERHCLC